MNTPIDTGVAPLRVLKHQFRVPFAKPYPKLLLLVVIFVASSAHSEPSDRNNNSVLLPDVALLFHGPYGERSYEMTSVNNGMLTLQEVGNGSIRLDVRRLSGERCTFVSTHKIASGFFVERLDFTKFDGTYQLFNACNSSGITSDQNCTSSLHFNSQPGGYCQTFVQAVQSDISRLSFPSGACRPFSIGSRQKQFYAKYADAFERVYKKCGAGK
jgi:hypothetical protein